MGKEAKYVVRLRVEERRSLESLGTAKRVAADKLLRARMLLKADVSEAGPGWTDEDIAEAFEVGLSTVHRLRQRTGGGRLGGRVDAKTAVKTSTSQTGREKGSSTGGVGVQRSARKAAPAGRCNFWRTNWWN